MDKDSVVALTKSDQVYRNEDDYLSTQVDGEAVIMNMETGAYFGLNSVATDIWNLIENPLSIEEILIKILEEYDVDQKQCEEETLPVLNQMHQLKIIISAE